MAEVEEADMKGEAADGGDSQGDYDDREWRGYLETQDEETVTIKFKEWSALNLAFAEMIKRIKSMDERLTTTEKQVYRHLVEVTPYEFLSSDQMESKWHILTTSNKFDAMVEDQSILRAGKIIRYQRFIEATLTDQKAIIK